MIQQRRPSGFIEPHQPSKVARPPSGPLWVHKIKQDGSGLMVRWDGARIQRQIAQVVAVMFDQVEREQHRLMNPGAWCAAHGSQASRPRGRSRPRHRLVKLISRAKRRAIRFSEHLTGDGPTVPQPLPVALS